MADAKDMDLVREFGSQNSETAFAELVRRHINLVYSVAQRFTGNSNDAQDVTQAVFIILARKAGSLGDRTVLTGWLYETTRFTAMRFLRSHARRRTYEQEASMQSTFEKSGHDDAWHQLEPYLEAAMSSLGAADRALLALRFYENKTGAEAAVLLGIREEAARKRTNRALEKLQRFFAKRGVSSTTAIIAGAMASNSMQIAPVALVKSVTITAMTKGAAASISTLTLVKGAMKIMAWTKMQTTVAIAAGVLLLAAGTTSVALKAHYDHKRDSWEAPTIYDPKHSSFGFDFSVPQVRIKPSIYKNFLVGSGPSVSYIPMSDGTYVETNSHWQAIGLGVNLQDIVLKAYDAQQWQAIFQTPMRENPLYDYVSDLTNSTAEPLQQLIQRQFGISAQWEMIETNVLVLRLSDPNAPMLKAGQSLMQSMKITSVGPWDLFEGTERSLGRTNILINQTMGSLIKTLWLESEFNTPIVDETGYTNRFDCLFQNPSWYNAPGVANPEQEAWKQALSEQLGLELISEQRPVRMLVVEKAQ